MSVKRSQTETGQTYFCTFTCFQWLPLFELTNSYDSVYKFFSILNENGHQVEGFVIMPNHLHLLVYMGNDNSTINTLLANGKRFLAYEIVKRLEKTDQVAVLKQLAEAVTREEKDRKKKHRVFEVSSDIKPCYYESYLLQKLNYIHSNPLRGKWKLAATPEEYLHSSAAFYELNQPHPFVKLTHYKEVTFSSAPHRSLWETVLEPEYVHSSATFYELNTPHPFVGLTHYKEVTFFCAPHRPLWETVLEPERRYDVVQDRFDVTSTLLDVVQDLLDVEEDRFDVAQVLFDVVKDLFDVDEDLLDAVQDFFYVAQIQFDIGKLIRYLPEV